LQLYIDRTSSTDFTPGSTYRYCNGGYVLLGLLIERVTGEPLNTVLSRELFLPFGLQSQMYEGESTPIVERVFGHSPSGSGWRRTDQSVTSATRGDGGIYASAVDMGNWLNALGSGLSESIKAKVFTPGRSNSGGRIDYGYGFALGTDRGYTKYSHTGSTIGFRTVMFYYPELDLGVAVMIARNNGQPSSLAQQIVEITLESQ
jgi:CubicO group peptidase (beta-lactamase class C family)